jgi:hypothetical protein
MPPEEVDELLAGLQGLAAGAGAAQLTAVPSPQATFRWSSAASAAMSRETRRAACLNAVEESRGSNGVALLNAAVCLSQEWGGSIDRLVATIDALRRRGEDAPHTYVAEAVYVPAEKRRATVEELLHSALEAAAGNLAQAWCAVPSYPFEWAGVEANSREEALCRAVQCSDALPEHWFELGCIRCSDGSDMGEDEQPTGPECFREAVRLDHSFADAYYALARVKGAGAVDVTGTGTDPLSEADLLALALTHGCSAPQDAWYGLMHVIGDQTVTVDGDVVELVAACTHVIEAGDCQRADEAWPLLLGCLKRYGDSAFDKSLSAAAHRSISRADCVAKMLERGGSNASAWHTLGVALQDSPSGFATVSGERVAAFDAFQRAITEGANGASTWSGVAQTMPPTGTVTANKRPLTLIEVAWHAIQLAPSLETWRLLEPAFDRTNPIMLPDGKEMLETEWCTRMLSFNSSDPRTLYRLARALGTGGAAALLEDGRTITVRECLKDCLAQEGALAAAWSLLDETMGPNESVAVNGSVMTRAEVQQRFERAGQYDVAANWIELGESLQGRSGTRVVAGREVNAAYCFKRALQLDPGNRAVAAAIDAIPLEDRHSGAVL